MTALCLQGGSQFLAPLETFHYIPSMFSTGLGVTAGVGGVGGVGGVAAHHPGFVIPDRPTNY